MKKTNNKKNTSLNLTSLISTFVCILILYFLIVLNIAHLGIMATIDLQIKELITNFRLDILNEPFAWITLLGEMQFVAAAAAVTLLFFWLWRKQEYILPFLITIGGSAVCGAICKLILHRARPEGALIAENSYSFPSNHAVISAAFIGFLIYSFWRNSKAWQNKLGALFIGLIFIILIGFSRLYLGVHYFSDVLAGYLLGWLWLIIGMALNKWLIYKNIKFNLPGPKLKKEKIKTISILLIICLCLVYLSFGLYLAFIK